MKVRGTGNFFWRLRDRLKNHPVEKASALSFVTADQVAKEDSGTTLAAMSRFWRNVL